MMQRSRKFFLYAVLASFLRMNVAQARGPKSLSEETLSHPSKSLIKFEENDPTRKTTAQESADHSTEIFDKC